MCFLACLSLPTKRRTFYATVFKSRSRNRMEKCKKDSMTSSKNGVKKTKSPKRSTVRLNSPALESSRVTAGASGRRGGGRPRSKAFRMLVNFFNSKASQPQTGNLTKKRPTTRKASPRHEPSDALSLSTAREVEKAEPRVEKQEEEKLEEHAQNSGLKRPTAVVSPFVTPPKVKREAVSDERLSRSWSHFSRNSFFDDVQAQIPSNLETDASHHGTPIMASGGAGDSAHNNPSSRDESVILNESYFEDEYWQPYNDYSNEDSSSERLFHVLPTMSDLVPSSHTKGVHMGVSSLKSRSTRNRNKPSEDAVTSSGKSIKVNGTGFKIKRSKIPRRYIKRKHSSLPTDLNLISLQWSPLVSTPKARAREETPTDESGSDTVSPDTVSPDTVSPDTVSPDTVSLDTDQTATDDTESPDTNKDYTDEDAGSTYTDEEIKNLSPLHPTVGLNLVFENTLDDSTIVQHEDTSSNNDALPLKMHSLKKVQKDLIESARHGEKSESFESEKEQVAKYRKKKPTNLSIRTLSNFLAPYSETLLHCVTNQGPELATAMEYFEKQDESVFTPSEAQDDSDRKSLTVSHLDSTADGPDRIYTTLNGSISAANTHQLSCVRHNSLESGYDSCGKTPRSNLASPSTADDCTKERTPLLLFSPLIGKHMNSHQAGTICESNNSQPDYSEPIPSMVPDKFDGFSTPKRSTRRSTRRKFDFSSPSPRDLQTVPEASSESSSSGLTTSTLSEGKTSVLEQPEQTSRDEQELANERPDCSIAEISKVSDTGVEHLKPIETIGPNSALHTCIEAEHAAFTDVGGPGDVTMSFVSDHFEENNMYFKDEASASVFLSDSLANVADEPFPSPTAIPMPISTSSPLQKKFLRRKTKNSIEGPEKRTLLSVRGNRSAEFVDESGSLGGGKLDVSNQEPSIKRSSPKSAHKRPIRGEETHPSKVALLTRDTSPCKMSEEAFLGQVETINDAVLATLAKRCGPRAANVPSSSDDDSDDWNNNLEGKPVSSFSKDYMLVKLAADAVLMRIPETTLKQRSLNKARVMNYLYDQYQQELSHHNPDDGLSTEFSKRARGRKTLSQKIQRKNRVCSMTMAELKTIYEDRFEHFNPDCLTVADCVKTMVSALLTDRPDIVDACCDFAFRNLRHLAQQSEDFLAVPPEVALMLLSNGRCMVLGQNGFPLPFEDAEREVLVAVQTYGEHYRTGYAEIDKKLRSLLITAVDPHVWSKRRARHLALKMANRGEANNLSESTATLMVPSWKPCRRRHEISIRQTCPYVTENRSRQDYLRQPLLSSGSALHNDAEESWRSARKKHLTDCQCFQRCSFESNIIKCGDIDENRNVVEGIDMIECSVAEMCTSRHYLYQLCFSCELRQTIPYIKGIRMFYSHNGTKHVLELGNWDGAETTGAKQPLLIVNMASVDEGAPPQTVPASTAMADGAVNGQDLRVCAQESTAAQRTSSPCGNSLENSQPPQAVRRSPEKCRGQGSANDVTSAVVMTETDPCPLQTVVRLKTGEHVTGLRLQGDNALHNLELKTNKGKRYTAHPAAIDKFPWTDVCLPAFASAVSAEESGGPCCLQALSADVNTVENSAGDVYLSNVKAVWACVVVGRDPLCDGADMTF